MEGWMVKEGQPENVGKEKRERKNNLSNHLSEIPERLPRFTTLSDLEIKDLFTPEDIKAMDYPEAIGFPGIYPFTRGIQPSMYRGSSGPCACSPDWEDRKKRTSVSTIFWSRVKTVSPLRSIILRSWVLTATPPWPGEIGKCGVAIDTLKDMEILFEGIPLNKVTTSMTINPPASSLLAMYIVLAEKQQVSKREIGGTIQNDMLKEFIAQKTFMLPPKPSLRIIVDIKAAREEQAKVSDDTRLNASTRQHALVQLERFGTGRFLTMAPGGNIRSGRKNW